MGLWWGSGTSLPAGAELCCCPLGTAHPCTPVLSLSWPELAAPGGKVPEEQQCRVAIGVCKGTRRGWWCYCHRDSCAGAVSWTGQCQKGLGCAPGQRGLSAGSTTMQMKLSISGCLLFPLLSVRVGIEA